MMRLFRRAVFAVGRDRQNGTDDYRRCGSVPAPLYRYIGDAAELLAGGAATVKTAQGAYTVLECAPVAGLRGRVCVEALLEERRESDDGQ